jgi:hypothetical protein
MTLRGGPIFMIVRQPCKKNFIFLRNWYKMVTRELGKRLRRQHMIKRFLILLSVLVAGMFLAASCELVVERPLEGGWNLYTFPDGVSNDYGNGTVSMSFSQEQTIPIFGTAELYTGSASLDGDSWVVAAVYVPSANLVSMQLSLVGASDPSTDYIGFSGTLAAGVINDGDYVGNGIFGADSGVFDLQ